MVEATLSDKLSRLRQRRSGTLILELDLTEGRRSGKATVAWGETFGEFSPGNAAYYLATAFDRIWLQPSGDVGLTGLSLEQWFYRGALDKLGLEYEVGKRYEYKNAADRLTDKGPYIAEEALELRLVDALGYRDEVYDEVRKSAGAGAHLLYLGRYHRS